MEGLCIEKGIVIGIHLIFGIFRYKTMGSCVYNKTTEKQATFSSFIVLDNPFTSIKTTNYKSNQIRSGNWCHSRLQHNQHFQ